MDPFQSIFMQEANDLIASLEKTLLELKENSTDQARIEKIFRVMHTLKGNSTMFGFEKMGTLTHQLETIYDLIRDGKTLLTRELLDISFACLDHIKALLDDSNLSDENNKNTHERLLSEIDTCIRQINESPGIDAAQLPANEGIDSIIKTFHISFQPSRHILTNGTNPLYLLDEIQALGTTLVHCYSEEVPRLEEFVIANCYLSWELYLATDADENAIKDVFIFVEDGSAIRIEKIADTNLLKDQSFADKVRSEWKGKASDNIRRPPVTASNDTDPLPKPVGSPVALQNEAEKPATKPRPLKLPVVKPGDKKGEGKEQAVSTIRVASDKLDELMNLVSELVTTQARLSLVAEQNASPELLMVAENIEKISRRLRDNSFSICLVPLDSISVRFQRLVRDLSTELGKDIVLQTQGMETEMDKSMIENLTDPLLHLLRNSMDHGIEPAEVRVHKGKTAQGKIVLQAFYSGTHVCIQIKDDGGGIDSRKIREKAISKGIIHADEKLTEKQIFDLIFLPGFSTAAKVTDISGRGVGMDVVRRKIADLQGEIEIESKIDVGTTITIKLPVTLSIIDGLLVKIHDTHFVIPLSAVDKCYEATHHQLLDTFNNLITLDGERLPFFYVRREFGMEDAEAAIEQVVVVRQDDVKVGLTVDSIVGEYQAVLKPLGKLYKNQDFISAATILGDGTIALVMDTHKMIKQFSLTKPAMAFN